MYEIEKNINRLNSIGSTFFLDPLDLMKVKSHLNKNQYNIYYPYIDSEKCIVYKKNIPVVSLFEIITKNKLTHQSIMGSLLGLGIDKNLFGDIIIHNNHYYFYVLDVVSDFIENNFFKVGNYNISLDKLNLEVLENYTRDYKEIELIVSSLRIDTVISRLIKVNRNYIKDLIKNKSIILNYDVLKNNSYMLKEKDTFSIKRIGKFRFDGIKKTTKSNNLIIRISKY